MAEIRKICRSVSTFPYRTFRPNSIESIFGIFSNVPRFLVDTYSREVQDAVVHLSDTSIYDVVIASQLDMAPYARGIPATVKILEELELGRYIDKDITVGVSWKKIRYKLTLIKLVSYLTSLFHESYQIATIVSQLEAGLVRMYVPKLTHLWVIPNGVDCSHYERNPGDIEPGSMVFAGALTYDANLDAIRFFVKSIFPIINKLRPDSHLYIAGSTKGILIKDLENIQGIEFTGYVDDIRPLISKCCLSVVPLRMGGGTRIKILESLALGTPVVATEKGAQGLDLVDGQQITIANQPMDFAFEVVRLMDDERLRSKLSTNGRHIVELRYDWEIIGSQYLDKLEDYIFNRTANNPY